MMKLIAESGSTKTNWVILEGGSVLLRWNSIGFNPLFSSSEELLHNLRASDLRQYASDINEVQFYGAGCSSSERNDVISKGLKPLFFNASVIVNSDLLAACRGLLGSSSGVAVILGTGSNAGVYDGKKITYSPPSLGYILGDEGSGNHLGRMLLKDFLEGKVPEELANKFTDEYNLDRDLILQKLYQEPRPNRFLASCGIFLYHHREHAYCRTLCESSFSQFITNNLLPMIKDRSIRISFTGSVAHAFRDLLTGLLKKYNLELHSIEPSPLEGLIKYHNGMDY